jgi:hypothetical protein
MNVQTLKWCKEYGVLCDWNLIYGFPGENPEDYRLSAELARLLTHLSPPTGCGPIRLDRFSPNYDHADRMGLTNIRPLKYYKYLYPFLPGELHDIAYYFEFDYAEPIDDGGYLPALHQAVFDWKQRRDQLYAVSQGLAVVIHDSRPVAVASQTVLTEVERFVFEICDQITTVRRIQQLASHLSGPAVCENDVRQILDMLISRRLVIREEDRYLGLPVLTYTPVNPTQFIRQLAPTAAARGREHLIHA